MDYGENIRQNLQGFGIEDAVVVDGAPDDEHEVVTAVGQHDNRKVVIISYELIEIC